ncbi:SET and MYND domain-containing protein 4 [Drosophila mauritiana]|uniref:SET and MYND domain-containing protein 4 n=1 Tax=Drosophila mauritiana TaxID=7226 RepID=A0A6P8JCN6_DROMA|nr:SET and MYND domain-containing protein 4 [Drosophila mauritiana]
MDRLARIFSQQNELITLIGGYKDEFETFKSLASMPADTLQIFQQLALDLLQDLEQPVDRKGCAERSRNLREEGNLVFKESATGSSKDSVLKACRLYTAAVFEAEDAMEELSLAFANRGIALQEYGYYREAYDDCANALECGYPERLRHKVIMRQAYCAWKLKKIASLEEHLEHLGQLQLKENFKQQLEDLKQKLELLKNQPKEQETQAKVVDKSLGEILTDPGPRGRYMVAKEAISKGNVIFSERASCFVPLEQQLICQQCAASLMSAPIPCPNCHQRVVYCSRKCRDAQSAIHKFECAAYRKDILRLLGISHLALRLLLTYIPYIMPHLQEMTSAKGMWKEIMNLSRKPEASENAPEYLRSLRMVSQLDQANNEEVNYHILCVNLLQLYLKEHTDFYDQFHSFPASIEDWQLIISALILRFSGQLLANGHVGDGLLGVSMEPKEFVMLQPELWQKPRHLKRGQLHNLSHSDPITAVNLPYLSLCNHACEPSIRTKFDGCSVVNYAAKDILDGEEIFNCYTNDYRTSLKLHRAHPLKDIYKFECTCAKCTRTDPDQNYLSFHRYRCEKHNCRQEFLPDVKVQQNNLRWWLRSNAEKPITCTVCQELQHFAWYNEFLELIGSSADSSRRQALFKAFDDLDKWLVDHHSLKRIMAEELITACFYEIDGGTSLNDFEYEDLARIIRKQLEGTAAQCGDNSTEYIARMTYLWDIIAQKKCRTDKKELLEMKGKVDYLASEHREVFLNYYNDFIEQ